MTFEQLFGKVDHGECLTIGWQADVKDYIRGLLEAQRQACGKELRGRLPKCANGVALSFDAVASIAETTPLVEIR